LGTPTEEEQGVQFWKMTDGNVILEVEHASERWYVNIFVTDGDVVKSAGRSWKSIFGLQ